MRGDELGEMSYKEQRDIATDGTFAHLEFSIAGFLDDKRMDELFQNLDAKREKNKQDFAVDRNELEQINLGN